MMKSKKIFAILILLIMVMLIITGCNKHTSKSYTYNVETGDQIEVKMDTTEGYDMTSKLPIEFSKDDKVISQGTFGQENAYDLYYENIKDNSNIILIEEKSKDNIDYFFYEYDGKEYNYIIKIKDSKTCFMLGNNISKDSAQEIFQKLEFKVK